MRIVLALSFVLAACGGSGKKTAVQEGPETDVASETCCCKSNPLTSEDGKPVYEIGNRMECSSKQGECVDEVQCTQQNVPAPE